MDFKMLGLNDIDSTFVKCIGHLYTGENLRLGDAIPLQMVLEEAIKTKTGLNKDFTPIVSAYLKPHRVDDVKLLVYEESKQSNSDNELELDLLKEDLMCIVCNEMDIGARNRLLECSDCHSLYHQECHKPVVTSDDNFDTWMCSNCKEVKKKLQAQQTAVTASSNSSASSSSKSSSKSSHRHSSGYKSSSSSSSSKDKYKSSKSSSKSSSSSSSSSSRNSSAPHNMNIMHADKRLQIMKKKAAKLQEKKKLPR